MAVTNKHDGTYKTSRPDLAAIVWLSNPYLDNPIASRVLRELTVETRHPVLGLYSREAILGLAGFDPENDDNAGEVAPGTTYPRTRTQTNDVAGDIRKYGIEFPITLEESIDTRNTFQLETGKARMAWGHLQRLRELRVAHLTLQNTTTFTGDLFDDNSGSPWSTSSTDIIGQVEDAIKEVKKRTGMKPNSLIVSDVTMGRMLRNDDLKDYFPGAPRITREMLQDHMSNVFGLDQILVGSGIYNSADMGQTFSGADIWSDKYAMVARLARTDMPDEPCLGRTLRLRAALSAQDRNIGMIDTREGVEIMDYYETQTDKKVIRAREWVDELFLDTGFAHLLQIETV